MRKTLFLLIVFCLATLSSFAYGDEFTVVLGEKHAKDTIISRPFYNIHITDEGFDTKGIANVSISIKNTNAQNTLYIFPRTFLKKQLRKDHGIAVKDEKSGIMVESNYCNIINEICRIIPYQLLELSRIQIPERDEKQISLPVYIAKKRFLSDKMKIFDCDYVELTLKVEERPDLDLSRIKNECDSVIEALKKQEFCRQRPTQMAQQEKPFRDKIKQLQKTISQKLLALPAGSKYYRPYLEMNNQLKNVDFSEYEVDCEEAVSQGRGQGQGSGKIHHCPYCNMSLEAKCQRLENIYKNLDNDQIDLKQAIAEAKAIRECCKNNPKHAAEWKSGGSKYKKRIEDYCKAIENYNKKH